MFNLHFGRGNGKRSFNPTRMLPLVVTFLEFVMRRTHLKLDRARNDCQGLSISVNVPLPSLWRIGRAQFILRRGELSCVTAFSKQPFGGRVDASIGIIPINLPELRLEQVLFGDPECIGRVLSQSQNQSLANTAVRFLW